MRMLRWVTLIGVWGCSRGTPVTHGAREFPILDARPDTGLVLRAALHRDTISVRDRSPVEVSYFVINGGSERVFDNEPGRFLFTVQRVNGAVIPPARMSPPVTGTWGPRVKPVLPARATLGQVEDLRCIEGAAYGIAPGAPRECLASYSFDEPGTYRVVVQYQGPDVWPDLDSLMAADTGKIDLEAGGPVAEGRRLADTVTLVVVP